MPRDTLKSLTAAAVTPEYSTITPAEIAAREVVTYPHMFSASDVKKATAIIKASEDADKATRAKYEDESQALFDGCDAFARSYIATACYDVEYKTGDPRADHDKCSDMAPSDLTPDTLLRLMATCSDFQRDNRDLLDRAMALSGNDAGQAGYDLYHTQVGSGVGFWETPDWPEVEGEELTQAAKKLPGEVNLFINDDGSVQLG